MSKGLRIIKKAAILLLILTILGFGADYFTGQTRLPNVFTLVPFLLLTVLCIVWIVTLVFKFIVDNSDK